MLREKKTEIEGYWNTYKKNQRGGGGGAPVAMAMTGGEGGVRRFCGDCGERNDGMKKFCGSCGANMVKK